MPLACLSPHTLRLPSVHAARRMPPLTRLAAAHRVVECVHRVHSVGMVHCDVKPQHFMPFGGSWKLIDYGGCFHVTAVAAPCFTRRYCAPEVALAVLAYNRLGSPTPAIAPHRTTAGPQPSRAGSSPAAARRASQDEYPPLSPQPQAMLHQRSPAIKSVWTSPRLNSSLPPAHMLPPALEPAPAPRNARNIGADTPPPDTARTAVLHSSRRGGGGGGVARSPVGRGSRGFRPGAGVFGVSEAPIAAPNAAGQEGGDDGDNSTDDNSATQFIEGGCLPFSLKPSLDMWSVGLVLYV